MTRWIIWLIFGLLVLGMFALVSAHAESGIASVYSSRETSNRTASGERMNDSALTAAHRKLPFGTKVRVTHRHSGHSVIVRITDRGPFVRGRVIDLTPAAARVVGCSGLCPVTLEITK